MANSICCGWWIPNASRYQSYNGRWSSNSSVQIEWVDTLDRIALSVSPIVIGIDTPMIAGAVMGRVPDAVHRRVAPNSYLMQPCRFLARNVFSPSLNSPFFIRSNRSRFFLNRTIAIGTVLTGLFPAATKLTNFFDCLIADVGFATLDQLNGPIIQLLEVIGRETFLVPLESQPTNVFP